MTLFISANVNRVSASFPCLAARDTPKQSRFVQRLLTLKIFEFDEMNMGTETGNHRSLIVTTSHALVPARVLACVEPRVRTVTASVELDVRFPHRIGRWIERRELERFRFFLESTDRSILNIAGNPLGAFLP